MSAALRQEEHLKGKLFLQSGDYLTALEILQNAKSQFGPHLGLLCDILCCHYCVGNTYELKNYIHYIQKELSLASDFISADTQVRTLIFLSKMLEEIGDLDQALKNYQQANKLIDQLSGESQIRGRILTSAQILRLLLLNNSNYKLTYDHYDVCYKLITANSVLHFELEHALMLYEVQNISNEMALERVQKVISSNEVPQLQKRLIVFDYLYELVIKNENTLFDNQLLSNFNFKDLDIYEQFIYNYIKNNSLNFNDCLTLKKESTFLNWMRVAQLFIIKNSADNSSVSTIKKITQNEILTLSTYNQKNIKHLFKPIFTNNETISLTLKDSAVFMQNQKLDFKPHSFNSKVLHLLAKSKYLKIEDFVLAIYESEHNESYNERVRMALNRFNKDLAKITHIEKVILINKINNNFYIKLNELIEIKEKHYENI